MVLNGFCRTTLYLLLIVPHFFHQLFYLLEVTTVTGFQGYLLVKLFNFQVLYIEQTRQEIDVFCLDDLCYLVYHLTVLTSVSNSN